MPTDYLAAIHNLLEDLRISEQKIPDERSTHNLYRITSAQAALAAYLQDNLPPRLQSVHPTDDMV